MKEKPSHSEQNQSNNRKSRGRTRSKASFPVPIDKNTLPQDYASVLQDLKEWICSERLRITLAANSAMVLMYWDIGKIILERQSRQGWGAKVIDRLSTDLQNAFPDMRGLSPRNLKYMRKFADSWPDREIVQRTVAQIPWRSNLALLDELQDNNQRLWYARKTVENGWSRDVLVLQTEHRLHKREGQAIHNFDLNVRRGPWDLSPSNS